MKVKTLQSIFQTKMHLFILNYKMVSIQLYSGKHSKTFLQIIFKTVRKTKRLYFATCKVKLFLLNVVVVLMFSTNTNVFDLTEFQQTEDSRNIWTCDVSPQIFLHTKLQNKEVKRMTSEHQVFIKILTQSAFMFFPVKYKYNVRQFPQRTSMINSRGLRLGGPRLGIFKFEGSLSNRCIHHELLVSCLNVYQSNINQENKLD